MELADFERVDLAAKAGALHLLPENADFYAELIRISAVVASLSHASEAMPRISDYAWKSWINSPLPMTGAPEMGGDPPEGPLVVEVACFGGGYLTIPANNPEDPYTLQCLLRAILHDSTGNREFQNQAAGIAILGLWLSDQCVRAAGLQRNTRPVDSENGDIRWPHSEIARRLENAVSFPLDAVLTELRKRRLGREGIDALGFRPGDVSLGYSDARSNPTCARPLLITDDRVVVVSPSTVVPAIREALLDLAILHKTLTDVVGAYREVVHNDILEHADLQDWFHIGSRLIETATCRIYESAFQIDTDKGVVIYNVCDDYQLSSTDGDRGWWDLDHVIPEVESCIKRVEEVKLASPNASHEIVHCFMIQGLGRFYILGLPSSANSLRIAMTADDFRVFSLLNLNDSLALWQVARARERLPSKFGMIGGFLDHYALFRNRGGAYYFTDAGIPDHVTLFATGIEMRFEAHERLDPHFVLRPERGKFGRVIRLESKADYPVYAAQPREPHYVGLLVEGLRVPIWVRAQPEEQVLDSESEYLYFYIADAITFWIWQLTPSLKPLLEQSTIESPHLTLQVVILDPKEWSTDLVLSDSFGITVTGAGNTSLQFEFSKEFAAKVSLPQNIAERELVRLLLTHLCELVNVPIAPPDVASIVDRHAPLGLKRRFMIVTGSVEQTVNSDELPRFRTVQSLTSRSYRMDLVRIFEVRCNLTTGPFPIRKRTHCVMKPSSFCMANFKPLLPHYLQRVL